jgi:hypothetical protein
MTRLYALLQILVALAIAPIGIALIVLVAHFMGDQPTRDESRRVVIVAFVVGILMLIPIASGFLQIVSGMSFRRLSESFEQAGGLKRAVLTISSVVSIASAMGVIVFWLSLSRSVPWLATMYKSTWSFIAGIPLALLLVWLLSLQRDTAKSTKN